MFHVDVDKTNTNTKYFYPPRDMFHMEIQPLLSWVVGFKLNRLQTQVADVFEPVAFS